MGDIAGLISQTNTVTPYLDLTTISELVDAAKPSIQDNLFAHTKTSITRLGPFILALDGNIFNPEDFFGKQNIYSDAYRLLLAINKFGLISTLNKINGNFSLAILDTRSGSLTLARDRFGLKPLFFASFDGLICFASRAKPILNLPGISKELNFKFIQLAAATNYRFWDNDQWQSPFQAIKQLPAGYVVQFSNGKQSEFPFFRPIDDKSVSSEKHDATEEYMFLLQDAVDRRIQHATNPIFTLSGGLDSSAIVSMANQITKDKHVAISTIHKDKQYDERDQILDIVNLGHLNWIPVSIDEPDIFDTLSYIYKSHDYPLPTATWLNHFILSKKAARLGYTDIFTGLGGDELHAGEYDYFFYFFADLKAAGKTRLLNNEIRAWIDNHDHPIFRKSYEIAIQGIEALTDIQTPGQCLPNEALLYRYETLLTPAFNELNGLLPKYKTSSKSYLVSHSQNELMLNTMPCCIRSGRENSRLFGLQEFHPFLDTRLFDFMMTIPGEQKISNGVTKAFARKSYRNFLPEVTRTRIPKMGWNAPAHQWFSKNNREKLLDMISSKRFIERGIYNPIEVNQLVNQHFSILSKNLNQENHMMVIWQIVSLELWLQELETLQPGIFIG